MSQRKKQKIYILGYKEELRFIKVINKINDFQNASMALALIIWI
jgi:hypothetical protein